MILLFFVSMSVFSMPEGLILYFDFEQFQDGIVQDITGNKHNGTLKGGAEISSEFAGAGMKPGVLGKARLGVCCHSVSDGS